MSDEELRVQTRNEAGALEYHTSVKAAFDHALKDLTVWKISFNRGWERVRFVRHGLFWSYEDIMEAIKDGRGYRG